jgi:large subunit ribosomal protein L25
LKDNYENNIKDIGEIMAELTLVAKKRETGKQISKQYRREGQVPGVFYRKGSENLNIMAEPLALRPIVYSDVTNVVNLEVDGKTEKCLLKDVVFDPITDKLVHFDLLGLDENTPVTIKVPFKFSGQAEGVRAGGKLKQVLRKVGITCLPKDLVEFFTIDITNLKIGDTFYVRELEVGEGIEFAVGGDTAICMVSKPRVVKDLDGGEADFEDESAE